MRYGIFSDVHSNLEALESVLAVFKQEGVERLRCVGDLVGYGADPIPCLERLRSLNTQPVCGNHDCAVTGKLTLDWLNNTARRAVKWTQEQLPASAVEYLSRLPYIRQEGEMTFVHGSLNAPEEFPYVFDPAGAAEHLRLQKTPVAFIGHTHVAGVFLEDGGEVQALGAERMQIKPYQRVLVNVGSVGQPRDQDPRASCLLYDIESRTIEFKRVPYPIEKAQAKIRKAGLPESLAERLALGY